MTPRLAASAVREWWTSLGADLADLDLSETANAAALMRSAVAAGLLELPLPGKETAARWSAFETLGRLDVTLVRLAEGHADALAILADLHAEAHVTSKQIWGVWAAVPGSVQAWNAGD